MIKERDPDRISKVLQLIHKIWVQHPELRLCQLIGNCFPASDLYYVEDDVLVMRLKEKYNESV